MFLKGLRNSGKRVLHEHRTIIIRQLNGWRYDALLCKTISYTDFKSIGDMIRNKLSWETITGVKQLSIFEDMPDYENEVDIDSKR